jgi:phosphoribosyl 1,2-cyclic phosphodiesterase
MIIANLGSSSSANCTILSIGSMNFIIDTGKIDFERIKTEMDNNSIEKIDAILITHSHVDHLSKNTYKVSKFFNAPIYIRKETLQAAMRKHEKDINEHPVDLIKTYQDLIIDFDKVIVTAVDVSHRGMGKDDSGLTVAYYFENKNGTNENILYATDVGGINEDIQKYIEKSDVLFIEANHCPLKVENSPRYYKHKNWLLSDKGHLSNEQTAEAISKGLQNRKMPYKKIILAHLSRKCNTPELAYNTIYEKLKSFGQDKDSIIVLPAREGQTIVID